MFDTFDPCPPDYDAKGWEGRWALPVLRRKIAEAERLRTALLNVIISHDHPDAIRHAQNAVKWYDTWNDLGDK